VNGDIIDMEFVEELDDVQLATVVGGKQQSDWESTRDWIIDKVGRFYVWFAS
jgi:hypothetical protein